MASRSTDGARLEPFSAGGRTSGEATSPDTSDFDAFFGEHEQPLYGYLRRMLPTDDAALDVAQEAFFRAWQHFAEIRGYERPAAWLYRVATNLAISYLRRRPALSFAPIADRADPADAGDTVDPALLMDPVDLASQTVERDLINQVLGRLDERQRAALLLRVIHGLSYDEIAQALGVSAAAARQVLSRGRTRFRALYQEMQVGSGPHRAPHLAR